MRRARTALVTGLVLLATAGCGDANERAAGPVDTADRTGSSEGPGDTAATASVDEVCQEVDATLSSFEGEGTAAFSALAEAAQSGDPAAFAAARVDYLDVTGQVARDLREIAATSEDPDLAAAVVDFVYELESHAVKVADDPGQAAALDRTRLIEAGAAVDEICA